MKLALLFLVCWVSLSHQQQYWPQLLQNRALFYDPYYFAYPNGAHQLSSEPKNKDIAAAQFRLFNKFFPASASKPLDSLRPITLSTVTTTEFATNTYTASVASIVACIPSTQFITQLGIGGAATSTSPCARKRRTSGEIATQLDEDIAPSNVAFVEPSVAPKFDIEEKALRTDSYEILSSQRQVDGEPFNNFLSAYIPGRTLTVTSTFTRTLSSYSFSTIVFKKTVTLAGQNALSCLPAGYVVC